MGRKSTLCLIISGTKGDRVKLSIRQCLSEYALAKSNLLCVNTIISICIAKPGAYKYMFRTLARMLFFFC